MDTREIEELSQVWNEKELTAALRAFIGDVGRLPLSGELGCLLARQVSRTP